jgi:hypothetical protein
MKSVNEAPDVNAGPGPFKGGPVLGPEPGGPPRTHASSADRKDFGYALGIPGRV